MSQSPSQALVNAYQTLAFGSITSSFAAVGSAIGTPISMFRLINNTDGDMIFSIDGSTNQFFVPASSFVLYDVAANRSVSQNFNLVGHIQFYVKYSSAPSKNSVYVESISPNVAAL